MGIRKITTTSFLCKTHAIAILAQLVEQGISNAQVVGSSPIDGILYIISFFKQEKARKKIPAIFRPITFLEI